MNRKLKLCLVGLLAALGALLSASPAAAWEVVCEREVAYARQDGAVTNCDFDSIGRVTGHRQYGQIKLCVYGNPVHFRDLRINFQNGGHQDVTLRSRINAGQCTHVIDLEGGARDIRNIRLTHESITLDRNLGDATGWLNVRATARVYAQ